MDGCDLIRQERTRQIEEEGWTPEHDDTHVHDELARLAAMYATPERFRVGTINADGGMFSGRFNFISHLWPRDWDYKWWKPAESSHSDDRIHELVKAGGLIAAEIDRIRRSRPPRRGGCDGEK